MSVTLNGRAYSAADFTANGGYGYLDIFPEQIFSDMLVELAKAVTLGTDLSVPGVAIFGGDPGGTERVRSTGGARFGGDVYVRNAMNGGALRAHNATGGVVADGGTLTLFSGSQVSGLLVLSNAGGEVAIFALDNRSGSNRCQKVLSLGSGSYSAAQGTGSSVNVYTGAGLSVFVENKSGGAQQFTAIMLSGL